MAILAGNNFNVKDFAPALWLDAADSNTLYDAVSGGALVGAGGTVARWEDKSGNGRHATQATAANRPLRTVGAQNTRDALTFDGVNDFLNYDGSFLANTNYSIFISVARTQDKASNYFIAGLDGIQNGNLHLGWRSNTALTHAQYANDYNITVGGYTSPLYQVFTFSHNTTTGKRTHSNGVQIGSSANTASLTTYNGAMIGRYGGGPSFTGIIAEIIMLPYTATDTQRQSIERYLANKWGLGFNPRSLSPALWLDAADPNTLFDATTGGNLVAAGGAVARWEDKSGNARHITQSTLANRPIRSVSSLGGKDTLFFDGVNDFMSSISLPASQVVHWFGVFIPQSKAAYHNIYDGSPMLWLQTSNRLEMNAAYTIGLNVSPVAYINQSIICSIRSSWAIAPGSRMRVNGTIVAQNPALVGSFNVTRNISMFNRSNSQTFSGNFAEQLWFTTDLSNADVIAIERYLAQKWNIVP